MPIKRLLIASAAALCMVASLASCTLSNDAQAKLAVAYDKTCSAEPAVYSSISTIYAAQGASQAKIDKLNGFHTAAVRLCTDRPTDLTSGLVTLTAVYVQIVALNAKTSPS